MVKLNKSGYTPALDGSTTSKLASAIDVTTNQGSGLVDSILRNVDATGAQAARDRLQADNNALRQKIGLSDAYFKTQQKYLYTVHILSSIDEQNRKAVEDNQSIVFNLQAREKIEVNTLKFYEEAKQKDPLNIVESTDAFINSQIEEAVKAAPNDKAVMDLYAQMVTFKVGKMGDAIKDKAVIRQKQIDQAIGDAHNVTLAHMRMNPTKEQFDESQSRFRLTADVLRNSGFSDDQIISIKRRYDQDLTEAHANGLLDLGNVDGLKELLSNQDVVAALGSKFDSVWKEGVKLAKEIKNQQVTDQVNLTVSNLYNSGKSPVGLDGFERVVIQENMQFLKSMEQNTDPSNGSTAIFKYFKDRNAFMAKDTLDYIVNSITLGNDHEKAALYSSVVSKMLSSRDTSGLLDKMSPEQKAASTTMMYFLQHSKTHQEALEHTREVMNKRNQLGADLNTSISNSLTERFGKDVTSEVIGEDIWGELNNSGHLFSTRLRSTFSIDPDQHSLNVLGQEYKNSYNQMFALTNNADIAHKAAMNDVKARGVITDINGYPEVMLMSPDKLGLLATEEGKSYFNNTLGIAKAQLASLMGMTINGNGNLQDGNKEKPIDIAPIPYVTGHEANGTVNYILIDRTTKMPFTVEGKPQYVTFDTLKYKGEIEKRTAQMYEEAAQLIDREDSAWMKLGNSILRPLPVGSLSKVAEVYGK